MTSIDQRLTLIKTRIAEERGHVDGLAALNESLHRREEIAGYWKAIEAEIHAVRQAIKSLPALPDQEQVLWAQAILALRNLAFLEIDTTGLDPADEVIRFTLLDRENNVLEDLFIKPAERPLSVQA